MYQEYKSKLEKASTTLGAAGETLLVAGAHYHLLPIPLVQPQASFLIERLSTHYP